MTIQRSLTAILMLALLSPTGSTKELIGWVENARLYPGGIVIKAKIDTGAKTSSLHCDRATTVRRNGKKWIIFTLTNHKGEQIKLQRKLERIGKVKRHFGEVQKRYIVKLGICLGNVYQETDINLIDRSGMNYPLLIGRRFLKDNFVIDPSLTFATQPDCKSDKIH